MIHTKILFTVCCLFIAILGFSQHSELNKKWFQAGSSSCQSQEINFKKIEELTLNFEDKDTVVIEVYNRSRNRSPQFRSYSHDGTNLVILKQTFEIEKITNDTLIIFNKGDQCERLLFLSQNQMFKSQKKSYTLFEEDTLYFPNTYNMPLIESDRSYSNYLTTKGSILVTKIQSKIKGPCNFRFMFIVGAEGEILRPSGSVDCIKNDQKFILKTIEETQGKWTPMKINGVAVNTLINFKFKHNKPTIVKNY